MTIFGESSGGACVAFHVTSRASQGLFARAILESPGITQSKSWKDTETNTLFAASGLTAAGSPGCSWPANATAAAAAAAAAGTGPGPAAPLALRAQDGRRWLSLPGMMCSTHTANVVAPLAPSVEAGLALCETLASCGVVQVLPNGTAVLHGGSKPGNVTYAGRLAAPLQRFVTRGVPGVVCSPPPPPPPPQKK